MKSVAVWLGLGPDIAERRFSRKRMPAVRGLEAQAIWIELLADQHSMDMTLNLTIWASRIRLGSKRFCYNLDPYSPLNHLRSQIMKSAIN